MCVCDEYNYETADFQCKDCHHSCFACTDPAEDSCLTCFSYEHREIIKVPGESTGKCKCEEDYFDEGVDEIYIEYCD